MFTKCRYFPGLLQDIPSRSSRSDIYIKKKRGKKFHLTPRFFYSKLSRTLIEVQCERVRCIAYCLFWGGAGWYVYGIKNKIEECLTCAKSCLL